MRSRWIAGFAAAVGLLGAEYDWKLPKGFPPPPVPATNPISTEQVELGRRLFYDKRLSVNGKESCATCHRQELAFTDGRARAQGTTGELHPRSSMSLVNVAYVDRLTWANPSLSALEEQAVLPMFGTVPIELGLKGREEQFLEALNRDPAYHGQVLTLETVTKALAAFERSIVSMRSPYDRYRWADEPSAISDAAKRGELLFFSSERAGCFQCHSGWNFSSGKGFFVTGATSYAAPNRGLYEITKRDEDIGKFRAPSLRNIAVTAPYMHDGSYATLEDVLDHYAKGGKFESVNKSRELRPFRMTGTDRADLVEFLKSLTDEKLLHDPRWSDPWK